ncbi:ParB/RepB/Spo0J family partition protein [Mesorhizobium sp. B2-3-4]|uniref:ParB/RepB/Spo0J family partition protein n=1 Tax=Mesorhizobium sp. B2-3-4 TaxID=2589959 RepID=UPI0015E43283|nr:ParB/RepB/Spo0J family partition protein [Mesorhizobium sp. B2-3-4]
MLDWIETDRIAVDPLYQRPLDEQRVNAMAKAFTWRSFGAIVVVPSGDGYHVTDGQHRLEAAKLHPKVTHVPAVIVQADDIAQEASIFVDVNKNRKNVSALELFFAELAAGTGSAAETLRLSSHAGIRIPKFPGNFKPNDTIAVGELQKLIAGYVESRVVEFLTTVAAGGFRPITANHLKAVEHLLTDREFAPHIAAEDLAHTIKAVGTSLDKEARRFAATHGVTFWKGLASTWFQKCKKRRPAASPAPAAKTIPSKLGSLVRPEMAQRAAEMAARQSSQPKTNVTSSVMGDPAPGRSALDQRRAS